MGSHGGESSAVALRARRHGVAGTVRYYLTRKRLGATGLIAVVLIGLVALFAPLIAPYDVALQDYEAVRQAPNPQHLLGTDSFGRDIFSRIVHGARISLMVGFLAVTVGTGVGALTGLVSGFFMGKLDAFVQRVMDIWMAFPDLILALTIVAVFGNTLMNVILAIAATILPRGVRVIRSSAIALRETDYVMAGRSIGASHLRIILRYIMPNAMAPFLIIMSDMFGTAILTEAGLSYLGLGVSEPHASWGRMLTGQTEYALSAPWMVVFPGVAISTTVLAFAFAGDALRDILDPRQRGR